MRLQPRAPVVRYKIAYPPALFTHLGNPSMRQLLLALPCALFLLSISLSLAAEPVAALRDLPAEYAGGVRPLMKKYCLDCHAASKKKGDLDLERFASTTEIAKSVEIWRRLAERVEQQEMPPEDAPQPTADERVKLLGWTKAMLDSEARVHAGDPGRVVLRRLSNAEYGASIRDLTGVDLDPAKEFPVDGAAGEGFTNAGDALVMSPDLFGKYLAAAKLIATHAVLLPDGVRFSRAVTRRDWTDEGLAAIRAAYRQFNRGSDDGRLNFGAYLSATIRFRDDLNAGKLKLDDVAARENLRPKYLHLLWDALSNKEAQFPLAGIRARWLKAGPGDVEPLAAEIRGWQTMLWKFNKIGSYMSDTWQEANSPAIATVQTVRSKLNIASGQNEAVVYLVVRQVQAGDKPTRVVWRRPRLEADKQPARLLRDVAKQEAGYRAVLNQRGGPATLEELPDGNFVVPAPSSFEIHIPAAAAKDRDFVVEGALDASTAGATVQMELAPGPPNLDQAPNAGAPLVASADILAIDPAHRDAGLNAFRQLFPQFVHHPRIVPEDEVISLRLFFREDQPLRGLLLDDAEHAQLDRLWRELMYVGQEHRVEALNLPSFLGFVSQEASKEELKRVTDRLMATVPQRAEQFERDLQATWPRHVDWLVDFASQAYRRPLTDGEQKKLRGLYDRLRKKEMSHDEAFRASLAAVLVSPAFLYRGEAPAAGGEPQPVSNWEMASRLSYFLWSTTPDAELRAAAAAGKLSDPDSIAAQTQRMLHDPKCRGIATEFAAQWLHVRDLRESREKNEKLFPTFNSDLRAAMFEETVLDFQELFQSDLSLLEILDCDHTFLNELLAKHYGVPGVTGPQWRRVDGVKKYGRGGVLALGSVLTKQSAASRTSPILRGNWLLETLLGEKLPKPPANVPILPEDESATKEQTVRQIVEQHTHVAQCAVCHRRIDPYGFSLEAYDAIGRFRDKDLAGRPVDTRVELKDGTKFDGIEGLRHYLLAERRDDVLRHFCRKLTGYALGRSMTLADEPLIDDMLGQLKQHDYHSSAAVLTIVRSKQFRYHRSLAATKDE